MGRGRGKPDGKGEGQTRWEWGRGKPDGKGEGQTGWEGGGENIGDEQENFLVSFMNIIVDIRMFLFS